MSPFAFRLTVAAVVLGALNLVFVAIFVFGGTGAMGVLARSGNGPEVAFLNTKFGEWNFKDYSIYLQELAQEKDGAYAYQVAKQVKFSPGVDLHLLAHVVSDEIYKQEGIGGMRVCDHDFRNACSHSMVVGAFLEFGEDALGPIQEACKLAPGGAGSYTMCFHGLGHGVLAYADYDMEKAVALCEKAGTEEFGYSEMPHCVSGVVMEMMSGVNDPEAWERQKSRFLKDGDPLAPCNLAFVPEEAKPLCYTYLTPRLFEMAGANLGQPEERYFTKAFSFCEAIPTSQAQSRDACFGGFGKEFVVLAKQRDVRNIEQMTDEELETSYRWCSFAPHKEALRACIGQSINSLYWGGENDVGTSVRFCELIMEDGMNSFCFSYLIGAVSYYGGEGAEKLCSMVPASMLKECKEILGR